MKLHKLLFALLILSSTMVFSQEEAPLSEEEQAAALAKATQNPLAAMYSLPFQNNTTFNGGLNEDQTTNVLNIQPVIPMTLSDKWNLINRAIIPVVTSPQSLDPTSSTTGFGDISYTAWFSPSKTSKLIWGAGPALQIPTGSNPDEFGTHEFGVGPSAVALVMIDKWVAGVLFNNVWTFGDVKENKLLFQYFVNYNLQNAWYLVSGPIITANWNAVSGEQWTVPFGAGAGKVFKIGKLPINASAHGYYNAIKPENTGDWQMRVQIQFLFPKGKK